MYRVIALDLDGTLLRSDSAISPRNRAALDNCLSNGMRLVIATGRALQSALGVLPEEFRRETWACCNGADIFRNGALIAQNAIDPALAREIVQSIRSMFPDRRIFAGIGGDLYSTQPLRSSLSHHVVDDLIPVLDRPVAKIAFDLTDPTDADLLRPHLSDGCRLIATVGGRLGEIMAPSATKAWAVQEVVSGWGMCLSDVVAFGDETNDVEMIEKCGLGVAMGNSHPEVKAIADRIALTNDEDGVALVLESLMSEQ